MVIVRIWEGLGNQLFQYAYARALQLRTGGKVYLDINRAFKNSLEARGVDRAYSLDKFNSQLPVCDNVEKRYFFLEQKNCLQKCLFNLSRDRVIVPGFYREENVLYKESLKHIRGNIYLMGWFQSENYFKEYRNTLLQELTPQHKIRISSFLRNTLKREDTVSVHIRRTDFIKGKNVLPISYYENAKRYIEKYIDRPQYLIFSDDSEWVREHMNFGPDAFFVSGEELRDYEEMLVMSRCRNNIIANSTFSWWGAWLNPNNKKIVIGPKVWAIHGHEDVERNVMPAEWIRIK